MRGIKGKGVAGFSLIEMLIIASVSSILLILVGGFAVYSAKVKNKYAATAAVEQNGQWIMSQIRELMYQADQKTFTCTTTAGVGVSFTSFFDGGETALQCNGAANPATGTYYIASHSSTLRPVTTTILNMVPRNLTVTDCNNFVACTSDSSPKVTVRFRLQSGSATGFWDTYVYKDFREDFVIRD